MQKKYVTILIGFILLGMSSCTQEFTCVCEFSNPSQNFEVKLENMRKNDAKTVCFDYNQYVGNCNLK
jgi:hypothetical protein